MGERVLYEWTFLAGCGYSCRIVEIEPGIVQMQQRPLDIEAEAWETVPCAMGAENEMIHLAQEVEDWRESARKAADTTLAEKSKGDPPLGYVRYELLAEAWDSISKLGRELFDARTRIGELEAMYETSHKSRLHAEDCVKRLEAENAKLRKCVEAADAYFSAKANAYLPFGWVYTEEQMSEAERWEEFASKANDDYDAAREEVKP